MTVRAFLPLLVFLFAGCGKPEGVDQFQPRYVRWILESPDRVTACRIDISKIDRTKYPRGQEIAVEYADIPVVSEAVVTGGLRDDLLRLMNSPDSFDYEGKGCIPDFGVKIRFARGGTAQDFYFCFKCAIVLRIGLGSDQTPGYANFDGRVAEFRTIVQHLFPDDPEIRKLR